MARGRRVRVLVRRAGYPLDGLAGAEPVMGDVNDPASVARACDGVEHVYRCAALVSMWPRLASDM